MSWPQSHLFEVRDTPNSGRGVFATQLIPTGTQLLSSSDLVYSIVFREYRREVCNWCFRYDQGDILPVRENAAAMVWCSEECKAEWLAENHEDGLKAYDVVEDLNRKQAKSAAKEEEETESEASEEPELTVEEVQLAWSAAEKVGEMIRAARSTDKPSKPQRKALSNSLSLKLDTIMINHAISGVIAASKHPEQWETVEDLYAAPQPYPTRQHMQAHITSYHQLLALLPISLLPFCNRSIAMTTIDRDAHNSFGIRSLDDDASEMFGYGTWPSASYWNHSCSPNIKKTRNRRTWTFEAGRDIQEGEELCITYLGGDEKQLELRERREMLLKSWKFTCACTRCSSEARPAT